MKTIADYTSQNPSRAVVWVSIGIGLLCIGLQQFLGGEFSQGFDFLQPFILKIAASQFIHLGWNHLLLNLLGLSIMVWGLADNEGLMGYLAALTFGSLWIAIYLTSIEPLAWYCGLSGLLHFLMAYWLTKAWQMELHAFNWRHGWPLLVLSIGLLVKLLLEYAGAMPAPEGLGGPVAYEAHRAGAIGGVLFGFALPPLIRLLKPRQGPPAS